MNSLFILSDCSLCYPFFVFFFNDTATTEIYTLSLHDALPISWTAVQNLIRCTQGPGFASPRSEEHTSELQSRRDLVCRLLLEKKKKREIYVRRTKQKSNEVTVTMDSLTV